MNPEKQNIAQFKSLVKRLAYLFTTIIFIVMVLFLFLFFNSSVISLFQNSGPDLDSLYVEAEKRCCCRMKWQKFGDLLILI